jgi:hypothetical protein
MGSTTPDNEHELAEDDLLTAEEAAALLRISRPTFINRVNEFGIKPANFNPALRKQRGARYRRSDVLKLADVSTFSAVA